MSVERDHQHLPLFWWLQINHRWLPLITVAYENTILLLPLFSCAHLSRASLAILFSRLLGSDVSPLWSLHLPPSAAFTTNCPNISSGHVQRVQRGFGQFLFASLRRPPPLTGLLFGIYDRLLIHPEVQLKYLWPDDLYHWLETPPSLPHISPYGLWPPGTWRYAHPMKPLSKTPPTSSFKCITSHQPFHISSDMPRAGTRSAQETH